MQRSTRLLFVASGTIGDVLPIARLVDVVASDVETVVITNGAYARLFPAAHRVVDLPFDPATVVASVSGQRMIEGGAFGFRRLAGLFGVVHPQIRPSVMTIASQLPHASHLVVSGIPFGTGQLASLHEIPLLRVLYQPHWPNRSVKSLYANSSGDWGPVGNYASHIVAENVAQVFFRRELARSLEAAGFSPSSRARRALLRPLLHESFYARHRTVLSFTEAFGHEVLRASPWAMFTGFIRPRRLQDSRDFLDSLKALAHARRPLVYCGFGSMVSARTRRISQAVCEAATQLRLQVVAQGWKGGDLPASMRQVPFGDHRLLFPLCAALIHHGGAGTVVASLDAGRPFAVVPQWADQFYWAKQTADLDLSLRLGGSPTDVATWVRALGALVELGDDPNHSRRVAAAAGDDGFSLASTEIARFCND
jgi:UDP:flavonoid glycosyltransferase YjiC (YdhE family)